MSKILTAIKRKAARIVSISIMTVIAGTISMSAPMNAYAAATNITPTAKVSFTFDDGLASTMTQAEPTLAKYGLTGTDYVITGCVGMTTVPNTCNANNDTPYMTWAQIQALQNTDGWEIGSHTVDHDCLASSAVTDPSDCANAAPLTTAQVDTEMSQSKASLTANGINATDFAPPYGDYNNNVMAQIAKYYATMRQFKNAANNANVWPYSEYFLQDFTVQETTDTVATVESAVNNAITNNQWLILTFHDIETKPSKTPDDYQYGTSELDQIASYVAAKQTAKQIQSIHVSQGYVTSDTNLLSDVSFNDGIADGWTTDNPTAVTADKGNNGSYPDPTNSIKLVSSTKDAHLFSPKVSVTPGTTYMYKSFLNVAAHTGAAGQVGFYIDEYDANGNWISGQWKTGEPGTFVENMNFAYTPSSAAVSSASLQVIVSGNAGITAYLDNAQMFPLQSVTPTQTNLVANGTFDAGITGGWTTDDPTNITADSANNGSPANPINSVKLVSTTKNTHLFSPQVAVASGKSYSLSSYLNLKQITGTGSEVAFYVDEYNASGTWISGQYKTADHTVGVGNIGFTYTPSSANVTKASLQVIVTSNSGITAYLDNVQWFAN